MNIYIDLQLASKEAGIPSREQFRAWVGGVLESKTLRGIEQVGEETEVVIRVVDEAEMVDLNRTYRGKEGPTNVLSFNYDLPADVSVPLLGDIVLCAPVVAREAEEQGKALEAHWAHLTIHGCLHLLGYEHEGDQQAEEMEAMEVEVLQRLGFKDPY